jgi:SAM-dependent methyltransferase
MDLDEYRKTSLENWDRIAPNWESERDFVMSSTGVVSERLVERLDPQPGNAVLDIAAGTGDTGFMAAERIGEDGRLVSTDFAPAMVEAARRNSEAQGLDNVEHRVLDAENMDLDDDSFDRVVARWGYMLMADPAAALAETRRVLRPGGRVALAVWGALERNPWMGILGFPLTMRGHLPAPEPPPAPGPFSMASAERTTALLREAGFTEVRTEEVPVRLAVPDVDEYIALVGDTAGPLALALRGLSGAERADLRAEVQVSLGHFTAANGYELPGAPLCAVAR